MSVVNIFGAPHVYELSETPQPADCLVFIHGWLLSRHYWQPVIQRLAPDYRCLAYDLRGFGDSAQVSKQRDTWPAALASGSGSDRMDPKRPDSDYSLAAYAADLGALLETLQLQQVWLLGHSLGGSIALWAAHLFPDKVQGVICLNAGGGVYVQPAFDRFRSAGQQMIKWRPHWLSRLPLLPTVFSKMMVTQPLEQRWGRQRLTDFIRADATAARESLLSSTTAAAVHQLPQIVSCLQQPVYFIAGQADEVMPPRYVLHLASFHWSFYQGEINVLELPNCGHLAMLEQPQQVVQQVKKVLEHHRGGNHRQGQLHQTSGTG